jgi:hypothetical protein
VGAALETAAVRLAPGMNLQDVINLTGASAILGKMPRDETWAALDTAVVRVTPDMKPQNVANVLWTYSTLSILRDVYRPPLHAAVWDLASRPRGPPYALSRAPHAPRYHFDPPGERGLSCLADGGGARRMDATSARGHHCVQVTLEARISHWRARHPTRSGACDG